MWKSGSIAREEGRRWMRVHAIILSISHAWNYSIQERPDYAGHKSTRLVAVHDGKIVGLTDVQYDNETGDTCFLKDSRGGYVLEFAAAIHRRAVGERLIAATIEDAKKKGIRRLESGPRTAGAQRFYPWWDEGD